MNILEAKHILRAAGYNLLKEGEREEYINSRILDDGATSAEVNSELEARGWEKLEEPADHRLENIQYDANQIIDGLKRIYKITNVQKEDLSDCADVLPDDPFEIYYFDYNGKQWTLWVEENDFSIYETNNEKTLAGFAHHVAGLFQSLREREIF